MNGSAREVRPGYWQLRVYVGRDPVTGRKVYKTRAVRASTRRQAEKALPAFYVEVHDNAEPATRSSLTRLCADVLEHLAQRDREPTTLKGYATIARSVCAELGDVPVDDLTPQHLNRYYTRLRNRGVASGTINNHHRFIHRALGLAVRWGWTAANVADRAEPPPVYRDRRTAPSNADVAALIERARKDDATLGVAFTLAAALGCRRGELCGLQWRDVELDDGRVSIRRAVKQLTRPQLDEVRALGLSDGYKVTPSGLLVGDVKTHASRRLTVGRGVVVALVNHRRTMVERAEWSGTKLVADAYVISDAPDGAEPWRPMRLTKALRRLAGSAGYVGRLHDLRHWSVSAMLDAGEDIAVVAERHGHSNKATTLNVYAHMRPAGDRRAAAIIDDALFGDADELTSRRRRRGA